MQEDDRTMRPSSTATEAKLDMSLDDVVHLDKPGRDNDKERDRDYDRDRARGRESGRRRSRSRSPGRGPLPNAGCRLFLGNIHFTVTSQELKDAMSTVGDIKNVEMMTFPDGRSKGCAIVEYVREDAAKRALSELSTLEFSGRQIYIREDREAEKGNIYPHYKTQSARRSRSPYQSRRSPPPRLNPINDRYSTLPPRLTSRVTSARASETDPDCQVYVGNLNYSVSWQDLKDFFRVAGFDVVRTEILAGPDGLSRGAGTVLLRNAREAAAAIAALNRTLFRGRPIDCQLDRYEPAPYGSLGRSSLSTLTPTYAPRLDRDIREPRDRLSSAAASSYYDRADAARDLRLLMRESEYSRDRGRDRGNVLGQRDSDRSLVDRGYERDRYDARYGSAISAYTNARSASSAYTSGRSISSAYGNARASSNPYSHSRPSSAVSSIGLGRASYQDLGLSSRDRYGLGGEYDREKLINRDRDLDRYQYSLRDESRLSERDRYDRY